MALPRFPKPGETYEQLPYGEVRFEVEISLGVQPVLGYLCIRLDTGEEIIISEDEVVAITRSGDRSESPGRPSSGGSGSVSFDH